MYLFKDVAEVALYHCVHREYTTNNKGSREVTKIEYSFEFLDDFVTPEPKISMLLSWKNNKDTVTEDSNEDVPLKPIPTIQGPPSLAVTSQEDCSVESAMGGVEDQESWLQEKYDPSNHPLELMVCVLMCICSLSLQGSNNIDV